MARSSVGCFIGKQALTDYPLQSLISNIGANMYHLGPDLLKKMCVSVVIKSHITMYEVPHLSIQMLKK